MFVNYRLLTNPYVHKTILHIFFFQIQVSLRSKTNAGLGSSASQNVSLDDVGHIRNKANRAKAADRFNAILDSEAAESTVSGDKQTVGKKASKGITWVKGEVQGGGDGKGS